VDRRSFLRRLLGGILGVGVAAVATRVQLGKLPSGDYGLLVTAPGGTTTIIDGTSNMFKIAASGTMNGTKADGSDGTVTTVELTALGELSAVPGFIVWIASGSSVTSAHVNGPGVLRTELWAAVGSGGSTTEDFIAIRSYARIEANLSASPSGFLDLDLKIDNQSGSDQTRYSRFYVLQETGQAA
jgi:hypothetical protein